MPEEDQKQQQQQQPAVSPPQQQQSARQKESEEDSASGNGEALEEKNVLLQRQLDDNLRQMEQLRGSKELMERKAAELASSVAECR